LTEDRFHQARVHEVFESVAEQFADKTAAVCRAERITYGELNRRANKLAHTLIGFGVEREELIGVAFPKSIDLLVAFLGVLKSGAAYVPLGENLPIARLREIIDDAQCTRVVTLDDHLDELWSDRERLILLSETRDAPDTDPAVDGADTDLAYVLYTSGSTGEPKGVLVQHDGVVRLVIGQDYMPFDPDTNHIFLGPISFDLSTLGIYGPLLNGAACVIDPEVIPDADELAELVRTERVGTGLIIYGLFTSLLEARPEIIDMMDVVLVGGEAVSASVMRRAMESFPSTRFVNVYGPTEATVLSTTYAIDSAPDESLGSVPIGKPLGKMSHVVVDEQLRPVDRGELGELCLLGVGVARGYLNRPEQTREKFPMLTLRDGRQERAYRSGDRVYELADGNIVFSGRIDEQVKIRGFRVELGAIEAALEQCDGINKASVVMSGTGDRARLHARVVGERADAARVLDAIAETLPEYMIPDDLQWVEDLPITANGKVNKRALVEHIERARSHESSSAFIAAETETQRVLCSIWESLLEIERVGIDDSFFDLGGHSLRAVVMSSRIRDRFGVAVSAPVILRERTIRRLARLIDSEIGASGSANAVRIERADRDAGVPMSFNQERLWVLDQMNPGDPSYNISMRLVFEGDLDEDAARGAWMDLHARHETLRTSFENGQQLIADVDETEPIFRWDESVDEHDLSGIESREFARVFDLAAAPLARLCVYKLGPDRAVLAVTIHHIISDAWSCSVLRDEFEALYSARIDGRDADLAELAVQYADYAVWQRRLSEDELYQEHLGYWSDKLEGAPMIDLPVDHARGAESSSDGDRVSTRLTEELTQEIRLLASEHGVTPNAVVLAAFHAWLHRLTGEEDVVVGLPVASRSVSEFEPLIGFFMETIAMRTRIACTDSFGVLVERTSEELWESIEHSEVAFQHVIQALHGHATPGRNPLFEVFFNYITTRVRGGDGRLFAFDDHEVDNHTAKFDLTCYVFDEDETMSVVFNYRSALFDESTMRRYLEQYTTLLGSAVGAPDDRISSLDVLPRVERERWDRVRVGRAFDRAHRTLHDAFDESAERHASRPAVCGPSGAVSYSELQRMSIGAYCEMRASGVRAGDRVLIGLRDPARMAAGILGALRAGAVYVPIDLGWPAQRIEQLAELSGATHAALDAAVRLPSGVRRIATDDWAIDECGTESALVDVSDACYLMFTSGSTGTPKGVLQSHGAVFEHNAVFGDSLSLTEHDKVLMLSSQGFDAAPMDMYGAWISGAAWCPYDLQHERAGDLPAFIARQGITVFHAAPSVLRWFGGLGADPELLRSVRIVVLGGEELRKGDLEIIRSLFPCCERIINGLGLTESSVTLQHKVEQGFDGLSGGSVPIGSATMGVRARLLDRDGQPTALFGELEIESRRIAKGYWDAQSQSHDPIGEYDNSGLVRFRTGDLASMNADGALVYRGRKDQQVKIHGCRVELGEVQTAVRSIEGVTDAAVLAEQLDDTGLTLVAYIAPSPDAEMSAAHVRRELGDLLPGYMVPGEIRIVEQIRRLGGGKLDRSSLRESLDRSRGGEVEALAELNGHAARVVAEVFSDVIGCDPVSGDADFFALGGTSLKAIAVFTRLRDELGTTIPVSAIFRSPTPNELGLLIEQEHPDGQETAFVPMLSGSGRPLYMLPGVGGHPLGFGAMIRHLSCDRSVLGVQLPGLDEKSSLISSIPELASYLIERMDIRPGERAPDLVGYSFGGALAFEIALRLQELGHDPGRFVMLDSHNLNGLDKKSKSGLIFEHLLAVLGKGEVNGVRYLAEKIRGRGVTSTTAMTKDTGDPKIDRMIRANRRAVVSYRPSSVYRGGITLVRAQQPSWLRYHRDDGVNGWARWTDPGQIRVINLDVPHMSLLHESNARRLGEVINEEIGR
jgi:amino acid adenylation domain-containing protein